MFKLQATRVVQNELYGIWEKGGYEQHPQFRRVQHWSHGTIWLDKRPDLSNYNEEQGLNLYEQFDFQDWTFEDGRHEWTFPEGMSEEARTAVLSLDEEGDLTDGGWEVVESETWFYGPLVITEA